MVERLVQTLLNFRSRRCRICMVSLALQCEGQFFAPRFQIIYDQHSPFSVHCTPFPSMLEPFTAAQLAALDCSSVGSGQEQRKCRVPWLALHPQFSPIKPGFTEGAPQAEARTPLR